MDLIISTLDYFPKLLSEIIDSEITGTRLFCSLLYVYPLTIVQQILLNGRGATANHVWHILSASLLLYFNFGLQSLHFLANIVIVYVMMLICKPSKMLVVLSLLVNMGYLCAGYYVQMVQQEFRYTITWTTPHCVLTLKLIGLTWDLYDGFQKTVSSSASPVTSIPSFIEVLGFAYYPPGLLTGPQISFNKYRKHAAGDFNQHMSSRWQYGALRLLLGIVAIFTYPLLSPYIPTNYVLDSQFKTASLVYKICYIAVWGQVTLARYVGVWLIAEGSCILSGIAYNGSDGKMVLWDGSANVKLSRFITVTRSQHYVDSFNINTNKWVLNYVYKRLRFLNNRHISQLVSLVFLAVWHGFNSGYFMCFFLEFLIMNLEKQVETLCSLGILKRLVDMPVVKFIVRFCAKFVCTFTIGYALISFELFSSSKYLEVYRSLHYVVHVLYTLLTIVIFAILAIVPSRKPPQKKV